MKDGWTSRLGVSNKVFDAQFDKILISFSLAELYDTATLKNKRLLHIAITAKGTYENETQHRRYGV